MSNTTYNSNEWVENAIAKYYFKYYEYKHFSNIQKISTGGSEKVYRANWKNSHRYLTLKSFSNLNNAAIKEIVRELKFQREVDIHENIIRFYGITVKGDQDGSSRSKKYLLVMEYADGGTLQDYLKKHFSNLTWNDKFDLALQLVYAVSCLHDKGIVHHDLNSSSVLVHQNTIKLADFGLSKRIDKVSNFPSKSLGIIPYIDPKSFSRKRSYNNQMQVYSLNEKSDVYSVGVLLWEISSGKPPFYSEGRPYDIGLAVEILQGLRETPIPNTPRDYVKVYTDCWNSEPDNRPTINQVIAKLKASSKQMNDYSAIVDEIVNLLYVLKEGEEKLKVLDHLNNYNITSQEIYEWLLNNQNDSNSIVLLGEFNHSGIGTSVNKKKAFELYQKAANLGNSFGMNMLGYCYNNGIGTYVNKRKEFESYLKAANLGNGAAQYNLAFMYENGRGIPKNTSQAIYWYEKSAEQGDQDSQNKLKKLLED